MSEQTLIDIIFNTACEIPDSDCDAEILAAIIRLENSEINNKIYNFMYDVLKNMNNEELNNIVWKLREKRESVLPK